MALKLDSSCNGGQDLGQMGEELASNYMINIGYKVVTRNLRCRTGEIDIVAVKRNEIHFVEVKSRSNSRFANPSEFVTRSKIKRILSAARYFLSSEEGKKFRAFPCHFDVISVNYRAITPAIEYIPDAFEADGL